MVVVDMMVKDIANKVKALNDIVNHYSHLFYMNESENVTIFGVIPIAVQRI